MLLNVVVGLYFFSMAMALIFLVVWFVGIFKEKPNQAWKLMLVSMGLIFVSGLATSYLRNQIYVAKQEKKEKRALIKHANERRDLRQYDVVSKFNYEDKLLLVMQANHQRGVLENLNGGPLDQQELLRNAQNAMYYERKHNLAKKKGIIIVSYVKPTKGKHYKPVMVLYASKAAVKNIDSKKNLGTIKFLTEDLSGYYFNKKYVTDENGNAHGMLADIDLHDEKHMPKDIRKNVVRGKVVYVNDVNHKKHKKSKKATNDKKNTESTNEVK